MRAVRDHNFVFSAISVGRQVGIVVIASARIKLVG